MPRGRKYAALQEALTSFLERDLHFTGHGIWQAIARNPAVYGATETFSETAVRNACSGKPIAPATRSVLEAFLRTHAPDLVPERHLPSDLDLAGFLFTNGPDLQRLGIALQGTFQTYAKSTTAEGYLRLGFVEFRYEPRKARLRVFEKQYRPPIAGHPAHTIEWEGYATPKSEYCYAVMRTIADSQDATLLLYAFRPLLRDVVSRRIDTLSAHGFHFEAERQGFMHPYVYLERMARDEIKLDFVPMNEVENANVRAKLGLGPLIARRRGKSKSGDIAS